MGLLQGGRSGLCAIDSSLGNQHTLTGPVEQVLLDCCNLIVWLTMPTAMELSECSGEGAYKLMATSSTSCLGFGK
eukprot:15365749-Ditylum_brightwellii.AAC.1